MPKTVQTIVTYDLFLLMESIDFQGIPFIPNAPLSTVSIKEVESIETQLGCKFPEDYREFISTLGLGETEFHLRTFSPQSILENHLRELQERLADFWFWDRSPDILVQDYAMECVPFFDSPDGDDIIFHPSDRNCWYILGHEVEDVVVVHSFLQLCDLYLQLYKEVKAPYKFEVF